MQMNVTSYHYHKSALKSLIHDLAQCRSKRHDGLISQPSPSHSMYGKIRTCRGLVWCKNSLSSFCVHMSESIHHPCKISSHVNEKDFNFKLKEAYAGFCFVEVGHANYRFTHIVLSSKLYVSYYYRYFPLLICDCA